jgi:hypothetical protein
MRDYRHEWQNRSTAMSLIAHYKYFRIAEDQGQLEVHSKNCNFRMAILRLQDMEWDPSFSFLTSATTWKQPNVHRASYSLH